MGFVYAGNNYLFEGGLLIGINQDKISDCIRNETGWYQDQDFVEEEGTYLAINSPGELTNEDGLVRLNDSGAADPIGVRIV